MGREKFDQWTEPVGNGFHDKGLSRACGRKRRDSRRIRPHEHGIGKATGDRWPDSRNPGLNKIVQEIGL
jgi:hypothetical protein